MGYKLKPLNQQAVVITDASRVRHRLGIHVPGARFVPSLGGRSFARRHGSARRRQDRELLTDTLGGLSALCHGIRVGIAISYRPRLSG